MKPSHVARGRRAFTLIEVLLATALLGALLIALNYFVFSMAEIWGVGAERRLFEQHVRAVTREVETMLRTATLPPIVNEIPIFAREVRLDDGQRATLVSFELAEGSPRLQWKTAPLPDVVCGLTQQAGKGLMLYWQSRLEKDFDDAAPRAFVLSAFGAGLKYEYLEGDGSYWRVYDQLQRDNQGRWRMPTRLRLAFAHGDLKAETVVSLPPAPGPLPHY
ncbi:prepilin-type N-terminal cleavage/methylation domain-containing protein [Oleiharenicola sp. Vm1]|uniref:prepilin-type N-terminal cleavage/methylation domain-containing protein n=1 Tax=Oleiharenicola sp. Vm1 TaxID=3398393 RepID=UPI0039F511C2